MSLRKAKIHLSKDKKLQRVIDTTKILKLQNQAMFLTNLLRQLSISRYLTRPQTAFMEDLLT